MRTKRDGATAESAARPSGRVANELCAAAARGTGQLGQWLRVALGETPQIEIVSGTEFVVIGGGRRFTVSVREGNSTGEKDAQ